MDPNKEIENIGQLAGDSETEESVSVDDFIKQLEAKEKDLHITSETSIIEIEESFDDGNLPDFVLEDLQIEVKIPAPTAAAAQAKSRDRNPVGTGLEKELHGLKEQVSQIQAERDELLQASQRRTRDFERFKSRTERERRETFQNQIGNLATKMLPALDNLNRAVDFALAMSDEKRTGIQPFIDGVVLVSQQVNDVLYEMGVQPIATVGEAFDPHFHEAVATEESDDLDPNVISAELLRGYRIGDRVIRHSMVRVTTPRLSARNDDENQSPDPQPEMPPDLESDGEMPAES
ncbi:MAG: nucleotide exchange factor GrpE [Acidobacteria bacterium]|nr:MAG: nucleotide exchange factor GrpE [Acidobacteriota bacterium]